MEDDPMNRGTWRFRWRRFSFIVAFAAAVFGVSTPAKAPPLAVVAQLDLARYIGTWHEIARLPMYFQRHCARDTTATYTRNNDEIRVFNRCLDEDGKELSATGRARVSGEGSPAKLEVSFFWPFWADYWVIALDEDYRWALVGEPRRRYLWLLARDPHMNRAQAESILAKARDAGYDLSPLIWADAPAAIAPR